jgi:protein TonB
VPSGPGFDNNTRGIPDNVGITIEPPAAPPAQTPIRPHSGIRAPEKIVHVAPLYPPLARASHVHGIVIIEATIDVRGNVESARVLRSVALLDQAALDAVRQWKFSPTLLNGVAVPIVMTVTVNFRLDQ